MTALRVSALTFTALSLVPGGAHLFELPAKMRLGDSDYFVVQQIYSGWALFAIPILLAILANLVGPSTIQTPLQTGFGRLIGR